MKKVILLSVSILLISLAYSFAEVPCKINYQGRLIKDNVPVDGTKTMVFSIYPDAVGGSPIWTSGNVSVEVHNGLFRYVIGSDGGDLSSIDWTAGQELYLEVKVETDILTPREELYAYPYAINSHLLEGATKNYFLNTSGDSQTKQGDLNIMGNMGIGITSPTSKLDVSGAIKYSGSLTGTILYGNVNPIGTPTTDGFRVRQDGGFFGGSRDVLVIEKTDGNADSPDGGIAFVNTGQDGIEDTAMVIRGSGNVGIGTTGPDATLEVKGTMKVFGAWESKSENTVYQAGTDGFVVGIISQIYGADVGGRIYGYTDGSNPPTTLRASASTWSSRYGPRTYVLTNSFLMPVRKDDYFKVTYTQQSGSQTRTYYWIPLGS